MTAALIKLTSMYSFYFSCVPTETLGTSGAFKHVDCSLQAHALRRAQDAENDGSILSASYSEASELPAKLYHGDEALSIETVEKDIDANKPNADMFAELRDMDEKLANPDAPYYKWKKADKSRLKTALSHCEDAVMSENGWMVFATPNLMGSKAIRTHFGDVCFRNKTKDGSFTKYLMVIEEAGMIVEPDTLMFAKHKNVFLLAGIVLVGDCEQLLVCPGP